MSTYEKEIVQRLIYIKCDGRGYCEESCPNETKGDISSREGWVIITLHRDGSEIHLCPSCVERGTQ